MIDKLKEQIDQYEEKIDIATGTTVTGVEKLADKTFKITTNHETFTSKSVLIAAGNGAFSPRKLEVESDSFTNLHYFVTDMNQFQDKNVVIFGGGDSAVDWALMLEPIAKQVSIVHRRDQFRAHEGSVDKLQASNIDIYTPHKAKALKGSDGMARQVILEHLESGEETTLEADEVIILFGFISSLGPIKDWGLELQKTALTVDRTDQTNISGIFAAGDAATFDGKIKMITTGFGEAVVAINAAKAYAYPDKIQPHRHSSTLV